MVDPVTAVDMSWRITRRTVWDTSGEVWRMLVVRHSGRAMTIAFDAQHIRQPGYVRRQIYEVQKQHFPDAQRTIPRYFRRRRCRG